MSTIIDLGYTGSNFSVDREIENIKKKTSNRNVFITDVKDFNIIKFKFDLTIEPNQSYCEDTTKIIELKNKLINQGFNDKGCSFLNQNGKSHYLYVF